jgi:hypothetical protein
MYERALLGYKEVLRPIRRSILATVNNLSSLYRLHGKLNEAEQMYKRELQVNKSV